MEIKGHLRGASNGTFLVELDGDPQALAVYKPVQGERPLWDFPSGTLSGREIATRVIDEALGFNLVPPTVWRESGDYGAGMCQEWIDESETEAVVDLVPEGRVPEAWLSVLRARDDRYNAVELVHADHPRLRDLALLDAVINNADRKAGHILITPEGKIFGIDHGIALHEEDKLRTVLWGWSGEELTSDHVSALQNLQVVMNGEFAGVDEWLTRRERAALRSRVADLLTTRTYPTHAQEWPSIPWPVF